ncbi:hypothetical protein AMECASPLE_030611 [Ameca splendens]|uniref:Uncharacterized protein n=1 Tax=Ameca splendens TaxID=208324 RepID=A0ABV0XVD7_9TELE
MLYYTILYNTMLCYSTLYYAKLVFVLVVFRLGSRISRVAQTSLSPDTSISSSRGRHSPSSVSWAVPWTPSSGTCLELILGEVSMRHPIQMPETPQLNTLDVEEQWLYAELLPDGLAPHPNLTQSSCP